MEMEEDGTSFLAGCVATASAFFFAKEEDSRTQAGLQNSIFFALNDKGWIQYSLDVGWACIAMATLKPADAKRTVVAIGVHGEWWELLPASVEMNFGKIDGVRYHLRTLRAIGDTIFAAGMGRLVLQRRSRGRWESIGPKKPSKEEGVIGFEDLDGYSEDEIYAVGWQGEIWTRRRGAWSRIDSPVSANLNAVCCASNGMVYAVGDGGVMLQGRGDVWAIVDTGREENLMDVSERDGDVYVVTDFRILKLVGGKLVAEDNFDEDDDRPLNCLSLERGSGALLSIAPKDVMKLAGGTWTRLA